MEDRLYFQYKDGQRFIKLMNKVAQKSQKQGNLEIAAFSQEIRDFYISNGYLIIEPNSIYTIYNVIMDYSGWLDSIYGTKFKQIAGGYYPIKGMIKEGNIKKVIF